MLERPYKDDDSLLVLIVKLLFNLALLVVPFIIPFFLPPLLVLAYWLGAHLAEWLENRITGEVNGTFVWVLGGCLGLSALVATLVSPGLAGTLAGVLCFVVLLLVHEGWKRLAGLTFKTPPQGPGLTRTRSTARPGTSAWSGPAPVTPQGEAVRVMQCSEFVMGGPAVCDYLLPDGSVINGGGASTAFSPDGRYFVTPAPSRTDWPLLILDRQLGLLHVCDVQSRFWEIDEVSDTTIIGRQSPLTDDSAWAAQIDELIAHGQTHEMHEVAGLKIANDQWQYLQQRQEQAFPAPPQAGGPSFTWRPCIPDDLTVLENPLDPLWYPEAQISVDGQPSGLRLSMQFPKVAWRADGLALACLASQGDDRQSHWWVWDREWRRLPPLTDLADYMPRALTYGAAQLDRNSLYLEWELMQPYLADDEQGTLSGLTASALEIDGKVFEQPRIIQRASLHEPTQERVQSAPLAGGQRLEWQRLYVDEALSWPVYRCYLGSQALPGEWLLDHRISPKGQQVALVAYAPPPAAPHRLALLDAASGEVTWLPGEFLAAQLQGLSDEHLYLLHITGRLQVAAPPSLEQTLLPGLPDMQNAAAFLETGENQRLYYSRARIPTK
ncbi:hypothetical protein [uncultured Pseudomonas sp.]|uniref:hypothetical protein n=1 Tax=uncultured Pseudomonas sp. TaxID=114707 RepID=UPI0025F2EAE8|nr:hypothetical protein [uncultured Pseudomonas sp.]